MSHVCCLRPIWVVGVLLLSAGGWRETGLLKLSASPEAAAPYSAFAGWQLGQAGLAVAILKPLPPGTQGNVLVCTTKLFRSLAFATLVRDSRGHSTN